MKAVLQVVTHATVRVDGGITGQIGPGLLVFLGVAEEDEQADLDKIVKKVTELRIFKDDADEPFPSGCEWRTVGSFSVYLTCGLQKRKKAKFCKSGKPTEGRRNV